MSGKFVLEAKSKNEHIQKGLGNQSIMVGHHLGIESARTMLYEKICGAF
jgi:hypothetical protein